MAQSKSKRDCAKAEQEPAYDAIDRRDLLRAAVGAGLAVTAAAVAAAPAAVQEEIPPEKNPKFCETAQKVCPPAEECTLPPVEPLQENQVEITVPEGREVIVREEGDPIAEVIVRVSNDVRQTSRALLVALRLCC